MKPIATNGKMVEYMASYLIIFKVDTNKISYIEKINNRKFDPNKKTVIIILEKIKKDGTKEKECPLHPKLKIKMTQVKRVIFY